MSSLFTTYSYRERQRALLFQSLPSFYNQTTAKIWLKMGSSLNKDQNVQVFITLNKPVFYAGQYVQGMVHINCLNSKPYHYLNIVIDESYANALNVGSKMAYHVQVCLKQFNEGIKKGHYNFPFSILLSRSMPASMTLDRFNFIKYQISAVIPAYTPNSSPQIYKRSLHIRQPPKEKLSNLSSSDTCQSTCCGCWSYGAVTLSLEANTSFLQNGKSFGVGGSINNSRGQVLVKNYKIVLKQIIQKVSNQNNTKHQSTDIVLYDAKKSVPKGQIESFYAQIIIPRQFPGYTPIGNIISRVYYLSLVSQAYCCLSNPTLGIHSILLTKIVPAPQPEQIKQPPPDWNPVTTVPVTFVNVPPYIYLPSPLLNQTNQEKGVAIAEMMEELPSKPNPTHLQQKSDFYG